MLTGMYCFSTPLALRSTTNSVKPSVLRCTSVCGVVRATTSAKSEPSASVMNVFGPLSANRLPRLLRDRIGADRVASGIGFGDREAEPGLSLAGVGQIAPLLLFVAILGNEAEAHRGADHEVQERDAVVRQPFEKKMHLDHALAGTAIFFGHHGADEAVVVRPADRAPPERHAFRHSPSNTCDRIFARRHRHIPRICRCSCERSKSITHSPAGLRSYSTDCQAPSRDPTGHSLDSNVC